MAIAVTAYKILTPTIAQGKRGFPGPGGSAGGIFIHDELTGLAYADSGHTGFAPLASPTFTTQITTPLIYGSSAANGDITIRGTSDATKTTSYVLLQDTGGNVGIGTTVPLGTLHIAAANSLTVWDSTALTADLRKWVIQVADDTTAGSGDMLFKTANDAFDAGITAMTLRRSGNVGIGTTDPGSYKLNVNGYFHSTGFDDYHAWPFTKTVINGADVGDVILQAGSTSNYVSKIRIAGRTDGNGIQFFTRSTEIMRVSDDGNVGIGFTAPLSALCINGGLHVGGESAAGDNNLLVDGTCEITGISLFTGLIKTVGGIHIGGTSDPGADNLYVDGYLRLPAYVSQTTGWNIGADGSGDFRYLFTDELHAKSFIADLEQALAGGQIICKSVSLLSAAFTAPAAGGAVTITVKDLPSAEDMAVFETGDYIRIRTFSRAAGSLTIADCWGVVTSYSDQANKLQTWTFTRGSGANAGSMAEDTVVPTDSIILDYGVTGNGFYEVNAIDGLYGVNSPYSQVVTWATSPIGANQTVRARLGNLAGLAGYDIVPATPGYGLYSDNVYLKGKIVASSGAIGGFTIGATSLTDVAGVVGLSSAVTGGDDIRFWAGHATPGSAPYRVTEAGALTATSGTIGGFTLGVNDLTSSGGIWNFSIESDTGDISCNAFNFYNALTFYNYSQQSTPYSPTAAQLPFYVCLDNNAESTFNLPSSGLPGSGSSRMLIINHKYGTGLGAGKYHIQGNGYKIYNGGVQGTSYDLDEGKCIMLAWEPRGTEGWYIVSS